MLAKPAALLMPIRPRLLTPGGKSKEIDSYPEKSALCAL